MSASAQRIYFLLQIAAHQMKKAADARLIDAANLSTAQAAVLILVAESEPVTQKFLADRLKQNESAMTAMVNRLLKLGYLTRHRSETDGRAWQLRTTRKGKAALDKMRKPFGRINGKLDARLSEKEIATLAKSLKTVIAAFEADES